VAACRSYLWYGEGFVAVVESVCGDGRDARPFSYRVVRQLTAARRSAGYLVLENLTQKRYRTEFRAQG
jgi:hypothetical protein